MRSSVISELATKTLRHSRHLFANCRSSLRRSNALLFSLCSFCECTNELSKKVVSALIASFMFSVVTKLKWQAERRAHEAETCMTQNQKLLRTRKDLIELHHRTLDQQKQAQREEDVHHDALGASNHILLAYLVRRLVTGARRLASSHRHLQATYRAQKVSTDVSLKWIASSLQGSEQALNSLLFLSMPSLSRQGRKEEGVDESKHDKSRSLAHIPPARPRLRCVTLALISCVRIRNLHRERMAMTYYETRCTEKDHSSDDAQHVLLLLCKYVEGNVLSSEKELQQGVEHHHTHTPAHLACSCTGKPAQDAQFSKLVHSLASTLEAPALPARAAQNLEWPQTCLCFQATSVRHKANIPIFWTREAHDDYKVMALVQRIDEKTQSLTTKTFQLLELLRQAETNAELDRERALALEGHTGTLSDDIERMHMLLKGKSDQVEGERSQIQAQAEQIVTLKAQLAQARNTVCQQAVQLSSSQQHMRMQAKQLRETQLKALAQRVPLARKATPASSSANTICLPHKPPTQQGPPPAMPLLAYSALGGGVDECQVMDTLGSSLPITTSVSTGVPPSGHVESKRGEEERLSTTQELLHFIQSLELQFGPNTHHTHKTHKTTRVPS